MIYLRLVIEKNMFVYELNSKRKDSFSFCKNKLKSSDIEGLGAEFYARINQGKIVNLLFYQTVLKSNHENFLSYFLHGIKLKSYSFNKYKTKKKKDLSQLKLQAKKTYHHFKIRLNLKH